MRNAVAILILMVCSLTLVAKEVILVQGAMDMEVDLLIKALKNPEEETFGSWTFWKGNIGEKEVIVSRTEIGLVNGSAATAIGIEKYKPTIVINQGTSGGHAKELHVGDIVLGTKIFNMGAMQSDRKEYGVAENPRDWKFFDQVQSLRVNGKVQEHKYFESDSNLICIAKETKYGHGKVVEGTIGSADQWNRELERIKYLNATYGTTAEEMESVASAQVAKAFNLEFLSVRVLSDSEPYKEDFKPETASWCQEYVISIIKAIK
ncbi:MAG: 5'-methylthioadenosine/S-adenosylhomocysteine nucleosidase [Lentisphaerota bacterium]